MFQLLNDLKARITKEDFGPWVWGRVDLFKLKLGASGEKSWTKKSQGLYTLTVCAQDVHVPRVFLVVQWWIIIWGLPIPHWILSPCPRGQIINCFYLPAWSPALSPLLSQPCWQRKFICLRAGPTCAKLSVEMCAIWATVSLCISWECIGQMYLTGWY